MNNISIHEKDKGDRDSLYFLPTDTMFIVEGTFEATYDLPRKDLVRITLSEVLIRKYDRNIHWEQCPVVGMAGHVNAIRKRHNANFTKVDKGTRIQLLGMVKEYGSRNSRGADGVDRRTLKIFADSNIPKMLADVCKRIQSLETNFDDFDSDAIHKQLSNTEKLLVTLEEKVENHDFVPRLPLTFVKDKCGEVREKLEEIKSRKNVEVIDKLDALLESI